MIDKSWARWYYGTNSTPLQKQLFFRNITKFKMPWFQNHPCLAHTQENRICQITYMYGWVSYIIMTSYWGPWRLKSPAFWLFTQPFVQAEIKENTKAPRHGPLWGEFTCEFPAQRTGKAENVSIWSWSFSTARASEIIPFSSRFSLSLLLQNDIIENAEKVMVKFWSLFLSCHNFLKQQWSWSTHWIVVFVSISGNKDLLRINKGIGCPALLSPLYSQLSLN